MSDEKHGPGAPGGSEDDALALTRAWFPAEGPARRQLGHYEILAPLGRGGMGDVYRARHVNLKKLVALKTLRPSTGADEEAVVRFSREMEAIGRIDHPSIVRATDAGVFDGVHCLVMEYLDGADLATILRHCGRLPVELACEIGRQVADGLAVIGRHHLVHRDIKPSNLFVTVAGEVKILDLGLARLGMTEGVTRTGEVFGTADYIAPEQASGEAKIDVWADVYSLGCTLYKLLTGLAPFESSEHDSYVRKLYAHVNEPVRPVAELRKDVPGPLADALADCLEKSPARRPPPAQLAARLAALAPPEARTQLAHLSRDIAASRADDPGCEADSSVSSSLTPTSASPRHVVFLESTLPDVPPPRRRRRFPAILLLGAALVLAVAGWFVSGGSRDLERSVGDPGQPGNQEPDPRLPVELPQGDAAAPLGLVRERLPRVSDELSEWTLLRDPSALRIATEPPRLLTLGAVGRPDFTFSVDISQIGRSGVAGMLIGCHVDPALGVVTYRHLGLYRRHDGTEVLMYGLTNWNFHNQSESGTSFGCVPISIREGRNTLTCRVRGGQLIDVEWNGMSLQYLILADPGHSLGEQEIGIFGASTTAVFSSIRVDGEHLKLRLPDER